MLLRTVSLSRLSICSRQNSKYTVLRIQGTTQIDSEETEIYRFISISLALSKRAAPHEEIQGARVLELREHELALLRHVVHLHDVVASLQARRVQVRRDRRKLRRCVPLADLVEPNLTKSYLITFF